MKTKTYKTRSGNIQYKPVVTVKRLQKLIDESKGFCLACGKIANGVEPDARKYTCDNCKAEKVYGFEELLLMGLL